MAAADPNAGETAFEPFLAVAVDKYVSDKDEILSFKAGQEILITGEVAGDAAAVWWLGKTNMEDEALFVHKSSVVKKTPFINPADGQDDSSKNFEQEALKLKRILNSVGLDVDKWMGILKLEQIRTVEDLESVLLFEDESGDLYGEMKTAERIKFNTLKEAAQEKAKLKTWISNAGLDKKLWTLTLAKFDILTVADLIAVSDQKSRRILQRARNKREEMALSRLLSLDLSGGAGGEMECLKGCGMKISVDAMGEHNCLDALRSHMDNLTSIVQPFVTFATIKELAPPHDWRFHACHMMTLEEDEIHVAHARANYWITPNGFKGPAFVYQLPKVMKITGISLKNTASGGSNDRGTDGFVLLASKDGVDFDEIHRGNLPDARNKFKDCPVVTLDFDLEAKEVRFDVVTFFGHGPGLHYFKVHCQI